MKQLKSAKQRRGIFVPKCNPDGTFARIQCHDGTGFCWCANIDGKPDGSPVSQNTKPNCTGNYMK